MYRELVISDQPKRRLLPGALSIRCQRESATSCLVELFGELDLSSAEILREELERVGLCAERIVVDLSALDFVDCAGIRALVGAQARSEADGISLSFLRPAAQVKRTMDLTGTHLTIAGTCDCCGMHFADGSSAVVLVDSGAKTPTAIRVAGSKIGGDVGPFPKFHAECFEELRRK